MGSLGYIGLLEGFYNGNYPPENVLDWMGFLFESLLLRNCQASAFKGASEQKKKRSSCRASAENPLADVLSINSKAWRMGLGLLCFKV